MNPLVERFTQIMTVGLVIFAVAIEATSGGNWTASISAGLAAFCLGLAFIFGARTVMTLVDPQGGKENVGGRLELLQLDLVQLQSSLAAIRLDARIQGVDPEEQAELEAPLVARVEAVEVQIGRVERAGDEDVGDEEIMELARARAARKGGEA
ncbi:MAG: hypothetical protein JRH20_11260 [Deltaproteobacteria bacterium]|nr:hypothetical protein [Deltaproteobacteria bacterium]